MLKHIFAVLLIVIMVISLAACNQSGQKETGKDQNTDTGGKTTEPEIIGTDYSKPLYDKMTEWSVMTTDFVNAPTSNELMGYQEMAKRFNVKFDFELVSSADYATKLNLVLSSGNPPYCIYGGNLNKYYGTGIVVDLTDLLEKYGQDTLRQIRRYPGADKNAKTDEGRYFFFPRLMEGFDPLMMAIYKPWLDELGLDVPETTEELYTALKAMKTLDPKIIPWTREQWHTGVHALQQPIYLAYGTYNTWYHFAEGEYLFAPYERREEMREALKFLNRCYEEGIIDQEFLSVDHDTYMQKFSNGQVGFVYGWTGGDQWQRDQNGDWIEPPQWVIVPALKGPKGYRYSERLDLLGVAMQIMNTHPDPVKAVQLFNWLYTDEGIEFTNWGIKGVTYTEEPNGEKKLTDMIRKHERGPMNGMRANGFFMNNFPNVTDPKVLEQMFAPEMSRGIKANEPYYRALNPVLSPTQAEIDIDTQLGADIITLINEMLPKFVTGDADIDTEYDKYIEQLEKMGVQKYIDNIKGQYERWMKR